MTPDAALVGDRYRIVCELGRGGMGVVYLGRDLQRDMDVAIKLCHRTRLDAMLWLKREFRVVAPLRHENLVELYELVAHDRRTYFTMEYVVGVDPREWVDKPRQRLVDGDPTTEHDDETSTLAPLRSPFGRQSAGPASVDFVRVYAVLAQLADALAFLHARGVIHRDVKPSNVLVADGVVKLLDFGIAVERRRVVTEVARERRVVGTSAYLAPEYVEKLAVTPALDVFALGVLAFELVTGTSPFGRSPHGERRGLALPLASRINPEVPRELEDLIDQMLAANPARRPSCADVAARLSGPRPQRRAPRARYFIGRARELARLDDVIADRTPSARFVAIAGPSGVGKTALVEEALGRARILEASAADAPQAMTWRGRCHERELIPYRAFDFVVDDLAAELAITRTRGTTDQRPPDEPIRHAGTLGRVFPALGALFEIAPPTGDLRVERDRALAAVVQVFDRVIGEGRGLVVIDDLQWADEGSLDLLATLVERATRPLAILATWSGDDTRLRALVARIARAEVIALPPMADAEVAELIGNVAPGLPDAALAAATALAAGNPYLAELIGGELAESSGASPARSSTTGASAETSPARSSGATSPQVASLLPPGGTCPQAASWSPGGTPSAAVDPRDAEARRFARLPPAARAVAEVAAVATGAVTFGELRAVAELAPAQLVSMLRELEDAHVLKASPNATGEPVYVFYHQRLHAAARGALATDRARALHLRFARLGERDGAAAEQLAHHYEQAGERAHAMRWAIVAADAARAKLAWGVAIEWYRRALALGDAPEDRDRACREHLAHCLFFGGRLAEAAVLFEELADADDAELWRVRAAEAYLKLGELERGLAIVDGVLARRGEPRARTRLASAVRALGVAARWAIESSTSAARRSVTVDPVRAAAYRVIASFLSTPYPIEAFEYVLRGIVAAERSGDRDGHGLGMGMLAAYLAASSLGRFGDRAIARARGLASDGSPYPRMVAAGTAGILATLRGDWPGMRREHAEAHELCLQLGLERSWEASFLRTYQALGEHYAGEPRAALAILDELTDTSDDLISRALLGSYRGRTLLIAGELAAARAQLAELDSWPRGRQTSPRGLVGIYHQVFAGELALAEGDWRRASSIGEAVARESRAQWLTAIPALSAMFETLIATAELGTGDRRDAMRARSRARSLYRRARPSFYAATALRLAAQAELRLRDPTAAARALDREAIAALRSGRPATGPLAFAIAWNTGAMVRA